MPLGEASDIAYCKVAHGMDKLPQVLVSWPPVGATWITAWLNVEAGVAVVTVRTVVVRGVVVEVVKAAVAVVTLRVVKVASVAITRMTMVKAQVPHKVSSHKH